MNNNPHYDQWGNQHWYVNGKLHRIDGPARIYKDGRKFWYVNGKKHREDGPAFISSCGGYQFYYLNDELLDRSDWESQTKPYRIKENLKLIL